MQYIVSFAVFPIRIEKRTAYNRAYLASVVASAQICSAVAPQTSYTLRTLACVKSLHNRPECARSKPVLVTRTAP